MAEETTKKDNIDINDPFSNKGMFAIDKGLGGIMGANQPKGVDTTDIDKTIAGLEKPASGSVYDKLAARYRSQGAGAVLRTQKNLCKMGQN
jgi:tRNA A-37 threonylcarbamoyl transferase component Bud32